MYHRLIQETEQPKRNPTTGADLGIVNCEVTVRDIRQSGGNHKSIHFVHRWVEWIGWTRKMANQIFLTNHDEIIIFAYG